MFIQFTENELKDFTIHAVPQREHSAAYLEEREQVWAEKMKEVEAHGGHLWNGVIYTYEELLSPKEGEVLLKLGTCEYKDLVFHAVRKPEVIARRFGEAQRLNFVGVNATPITSDHKLVLGLRADRTEPTLGGIGGGLNKDEWAVTSLNDVYISMLREIQEETAFEVRKEDLHLVGLVMSGLLRNLCFTFNVPALAEEIDQFAKPGEISRLVAMTRKDVLSTQMVMRPEIRALRPYLQYL